MAIIKHVDVYYGPFDSEREATEWAKTYLPDGGWEIIVPHPPRYPDPYRSI
jgi:hypothetical protein